MRHRDKPRMPHRDVEPGEKDCPDQQLRQDLNVIGRLKDEWQDCEKKDTCRRWQYVGTIEHQATLTDLPNRPCGRTISTRTNSTTG